MRKSLLSLLLAFVVASATALEIEQIDPAMAARPADSESVTWHLPYEAPMKLFGFPWFETEGRYARLPMNNLPAQVTQYNYDGKPVTVEAEKCGALILAPYTAGGQVRFRTDSSCFAIHAEVASAYPMYHMTCIGKSGFDIYIKAGDKWKCVGVSRISVNVPEYTANMVSGLKREMRDVVINFPLYTSVKSLAIGLDKDAAIEAPTPFHDKRPIVFYGTSITQGGCATRPGMASSNILSRMLDREVVNEGFSGSGVGEPEIASMLADIPDVALYILDYVPNSNIEPYKTSLPQFIDILRAKHPDTPILILPGTPQDRDIDAFTRPHVRFMGMRDVAKEECQKRNAAGDKNIFFFDIYELWLQRDFWEYEVDGVHLTDLGFLHFAQDIAPEIKKILGE